MVVSCHPWHHDINISLYVDVKERVYTGRIVYRGHMVVSCHSWHYDINIPLYVDVKERVCSELTVKSINKSI